MTLTEELLTAKGTISALAALDEDEHVDTATLADEMDVSEGTARTRLNQLADAGLVDEDAELRDGRPVRVFYATEEGSEVAATLTALLDGETTGADADDETEDEEDDEDEDDE